MQVWDRGLSVGKNPRESPESSRNDAGFALRPTFGGPIPGNLPASDQSCQGRLYILPVRRKNLPPPLFNFGADERILSPFEVISGALGWPGASGCHGWPTLVSFGGFWPSAILAGPGGMSRIGSGVSVRIAVARAGTGRNPEGPERVLPDVLPDAAALDMMAIRVAVTLPER